MHFEPTAPLAELIMRHAGKRICVMGGGKTLQADIEGIEADVWISVNNHGAKLRSVDYIVCMDNIHTANKREMRHFLRQFSDAPIISPWHWGQYQMHKWPGYPRMYNSGVMAVWVAYLMGAHPVIMAGYDCYNGDKKIIDMHRYFVPEVRCQVRVASGALIGMYPKHESTENFDKFAIPEILGDARDGCVKVKVKSIFTYRGCEWPIGTILTLPEFEVRRQIKHKSLEIVPDEKTDKA